MQCFFILWEITKPSQPLQLTTYQISYSLNIDKFGQSYDRAESHATCVVEGNYEILLESVLKAGKPKLHAEKKLTSSTSELTKIKPREHHNEKYIKDANSTPEQACIITQQQRFVDTLDRRERKTRMEVTDVPDECEKLLDAAIDEDKLRKLWAGFRVCFYQALLVILDSRYSNGQR